MIPLNQMCLICFLRTSAVVLDSMIGHIGLTHGKYELIQDLELEKLEQLSKVFQTDQHLLCPNLLWQHSFHRQRSSLY